MTRARIDIEAGYKPDEAPLVDFLAALLAAVEHVPQRPASAPVFRAEILSVDGTPQVFLSVQYETAQNSR